MESKLESKHHQHDVPPTLGVTLSFLRRMLSMFPEYELPEDAATGALCHLCVVPLTSAKACSFLDLHAESPGVSGPATHFISHAWGRPFRETLGAIENALQQLGEREADSYLWFDVAVVNQHAAPTVDFDTTFKAAVANIGSTIFCASPWQRPVAFGRCWCLWELFCSLDCRLTVALTAADEKDFVEGQLNGVGLQDVCELESIEPMALWEGDAVSSKSASATVLEDRRRIRAAVRRGIGFRGLDREVLTAMRTWIERIVGAHMSDAIRAVDATLPGDVASLRKATMLIDDDKDTRQLLELAQRLAALARENHCYALARRFYVAVLEARLGPGYADAAPQPSGASLWAFRHLLFLCEPDVFTHVWEATNAPKSEINPFGGGSFGVLPDDDDDDDSDWLPEEHEEESEDDDEDEEEDDDEEEDNNREQSFFYAEHHDDDDEDDDEDEDEDQYTPAWVKPSAAVMASFDVVKEQFLAVLAARLASYDIQKEKGEDVDVAFAQRLCTEPSTRIGLVMLHEAGKLEAKAMQRWSMMVENVGSDDKEVETDDVGK